MKLYQLMFGLHFIFATVCHILVPFMFIGIIKLLFYSNLNFYINCVILGSSIFSLQFIINHLNNPDSFCLLTHLENYYRRKQDLITYDDFLPRYYDTLIQAYKYLKNKVNNQ